MERILRIECSVDLSKYWRHLYSRYRAKTTANRNLSQGKLGIQLEIDMVGMDDRVLVQKIRLCKKTIEEKEQKYKQEK